VIPTHTFREKAHAASEEGEEGAKETLKMFVGGGWLWGGWGGICCRGGEGGGGGESLVGVLWVL